MSYLLSDLRITDSVHDYILDLIKVYFSLEVSEIPQLGVGVHRRVTGMSRTALEDSIAADISSFVSKLSEEGIKISIKNITSSENKVYATLVYEGEDINFTLS